MAYPKRLRELSEAVKSRSTNASFACSGSLPLKSGLPTSKEGLPLLKAGVTVRWDSSGQFSHKLKLPIDGSESENLELLLKSCQPATFGRGGEDVLDESYRKAVKLDRSCFSIDFNPYEYGIIDTISQILLPSIAGKDRLQLRGVRAELYKLNFYSAPGDKFRAHVDTPRSTNQFGSLVICLPVKHEGGILVVRHQSKSLEFDWSPDSHDTVQWAAFYSDCEHEIKEVTSGHRLTITYNLYAVEDTGILAGRIGYLDPRQLPLFSIARNLITQKSFLPNGGVIGYACSHAYAHTNETSIETLPYALKGIDMALYETMKQLGLPTYMRPILQEDFTRRGPGREKAVTGRRLLATTKSHSINEEYQVDSDGKEIQQVPEDFPHQRNSIYWLNAPETQNMELQHAGVTYGNEASLEVYYSYAALCFKVLPYPERMKNLTKGTRGDKIRDNGDLSGPKEPKKKRPGDEWNGD